MQHENFKAKVMEAYEEQKAGVSAGGLLNLRGVIARRLFLVEPEDVQARIKREVENEHAALLEKHEDTLEGSPALDEEGLDE
jgi:uncharacterized protein with HEPN domain